jgi:hypothetical protein
MGAAKTVLLLASIAVLTASAQGQTRRPTPTPTPWPNKAPSVKLTSSLGRVVLPSGCGEEKSVAAACAPTGPKVELRAEAADPDKDSLLYTYSTTGGRIEGDGPDVTLDLTGVAPGTYTVTAEVDDGNGGVVTDEVKIKVERCSCPAPLVVEPCPAVTVSCPSEPWRPGTPVTFTAKVAGGDPNVTPTFNWTVSAGTITSGQGTGTITVDTSGVAQTSFVTATVGVGGYDRSCSTAASCTLGSGYPPPARKLDEYGDINFDEERARLDSLSVELENDPAAQGYLVCYGGRRGRRDEARRRCARARDYLGRARAPARLVTVDGGFREQPSVELWVVPSGATPPYASPTVDPQEVRPPALRK